MGEYMEMFDRGIVDDVAVLRGSELPDAEEILERKAIVMQQQQALQQYEEEIKKMKGDLQTWTREAQHAKQKAELEKFKAGLARMEAEVKKDISIFKFGLESDRKVEQAKSKKPQQAAT
jgi:t-SNARE complex subunit (syntaxin)